MFKKALLNTSAQLAGKVVSAICAFVATIILARSLGSNYFGEYIKITAFITLFYPLVDFGLNALFLKEAKNHELQLFGTFFTLRLVISLAVAILFIGATVGVTKTMPGLAFTLSMIVMGIFALIGYAVTLNLHVIFQLRLAYNKIAFSLAIGTMSYLLLVVILYPKLALQNNISVLLALLIFVISVWVTTFISLMLLSRTSFTLVYNYGFWRKILSVSWPLGLTLILNSVYFRIDTLILSLFRSSPEVGAYGFAYKFFEFGLVLPAFFMNSIYPELVQKNRLDPQMKTDFKSIKKLMTVFAFIAMLAVWVFSPLLAIVKSDYVYSVVLLRLLSLSLPFFYLSSPYMWWYILHNEQRKLIFIYALALVIVLLGNLILIPIYGAVGAAITTIVVELIVLLLLVSYLPKS